MGFALCVDDRLALERAYQIQIVRGHEGFDGILVVAIERRLIVIEQFHPAIFAARHHVHFASAGVHNFERFTAPENGNGIGQKPGEAFGRYTECPCRSGTVAGLTIAF